MYFSALSLLIMICTAHVTELLLSHFPELAPELDTLKSANSLPRQLSIFALFTQQAAEEGNLTTLKQCLAVADLLCDEDEQLEQAIQHTYLHHLRFKNTAYSMQLARLLMPIHLYTMFTRS